MPSLANQLFALLALLIVLSGCQDNTARYQEIEAELSKAGGNFHSRDQEVAYILNQCDLEQLSWERIFPLPQLTAVLLEGSNFSDAQVRFLLNCPNLVDVHCPYTNITDGGVSQLRGMNNLQNLDLSGCHITDACIPDLLAIDSLEMLFVKQTHITPVGAKILEKQFIVVWSQVPSEKVRQTLCDLRRHNFEFKESDSTTDQQDTSPVYSVDFDGITKMSDNITEQLNMLSHSSNLILSLDSETHLRKLQGIDGPIHRIYLFEPWGEEQTFDKTSLTILSELHVRQLWLALNDLTPEQLRSVANTPGLKNLEMFDQTITPEEWKTLVQIPSLETLIFHDTKFQDIDKFSPAEHNIQLELYGTDESDTKLEKQLTKLVTPNEDER